MGSKGYPQVLLLGNGINRAYARDSWNDLIKTIAGGKPCESNLPMPLKIVQATNNQVEARLKEFLLDATNLKGEVTQHDMRKTLRRVLAMGFSDILTTNYSYELEIAATDMAQVGMRQLIKVRRHTSAVCRAEGKYFLHTYQEVAYEGVTNRIWHIHGEARNPSSIVIGHYHYGNLFSKIRQYLKQVGNGYAIKQDMQETGNEKVISTRSWIDSFILGDIYIVGFGYNVAEFDMWWLLERKIREKARTGKVHYYYREMDAEKTDVCDVLNLLKCYGVVLHPMPEVEYPCVWNRALDEIHDQLKNT